MKLLLKISIVVFICIFSLNTHAQVATPIDGVTIDTNISNPKAGDPVEVFLESFSFDLNASSIVWTVNGKLQTQGVGIKKITVTAPKIGSPMTVSAMIKKADGAEVRKSITIKTGYIDIIWESDGYVPPFFEGKVPFSYQNAVKFTAIPHISKTGTTEIDPKTLIYSWKRDGKYVDEGQGYGKQSITIPSDDLPRPLAITVEVSNREQTNYFMGSINLTPSEPSITFYENDALYGIFYNRALGEKVSLKNTEMEILSVPYGFNLNGKQNSYTWSINNVEQPDLIRERSITVRTKGDVDGTSDISLDIRNLSNILQGARKAFTVSYTKNKEVEEEVTF